MILFALASKIWNPWPLPVVKKVQVRGGFSACADVGAWSAATPNAVAIKIEPPTKTARREAMRGKLACAVAKSQRPRTRSNKPRKRAQAECRGGALSRSLRREKKAIRSRLRDDAQQDFVCGWQLRHLREIPPLRQEQRRAGVGLVEQRMRRLGNRLAIEELRDADRGE